MPLLGPTGVSSRVSAHSRSDPDRRKASVGSGSQTAWRTFTNAWRSSRAVGVRRSQADQVAGAWGQRELLGSFDGCLSLAPLPVASVRVLRETLRWAA